MSEAYVKQAIVVANTAAAKFAGPNDGPQARSPSVQYLRAWNQSFHYACDLIFCAAGIRRTTKCDRHYQLNEYEQEADRILKRDMDIRRAKLCT